MPSALISGASIAGPALAYWLAEAGWDCTIVEKSPTVRGGGYPIDLRGSAVEVVKRMGVYDQIRSKVVGVRTLRLVTRRNRTLAKLDMSGVLNDDATGDVELPRGALAEILFGATRSDVDYIFNDSITSLTQQEDRVDVAFVSSEPRSFDIVVGADGIHSTTRRLVFGPEDDFVHHLGPMVMVFDVDGVDWAPGKALMYNRVGRMATATKEVTGPLRGFMAFLVDDPGSLDTSDEKAASVLAKTVYGEDAKGVKHVRMLLEELPRSKDLFFDTVSQTRMDKWYDRRVALVGDAAYAPAFLSGQGTSIAIIGAYVLASELAAHPDPTAAFEAYDRKLRPFVERNQKLALRRDNTALQTTRKGLRNRNLMFMLLPVLIKTGILARLQRGYRDTTNGFDLDGYGL